MTGSDLHATAGSASRRPSARKTFYTRTRTLAEKLVGAEGVGGALRGVQHVLGNLEPEAGERADHKTVGTADQRGSEADKQDTRAVALAIALAIWLAECAFVPLLGFRAVDGRAAFFVIAVATGCLLPCAVCMGPR